MGILDKIFKREELLTAEQREELKEIERKAFMEKAKEIVKRRGEQKALNNIKN